MEEVKAKLADYAHRAWSGWMTYLFSKSSVNEDGSVTIPAESVARWKRQMVTPYSNLPDLERVSDLDEADKMMKILGSYSDDSQV